MHRARALAALLAVVGLPTCAISSTPATQPAAVCGPLAVQQKQVTLNASDSPTPGFELPAGTEPVGLISDRDGASIWLLGTGANDVLHVQPDGRATDYALPNSTLGIQLSQARDGTVWVPEQYRDAVAAIAPDGKVTECHLPGKNLEPQATSAATDGSVWVSEGLGAAIAHLVDGKFTRYPIGQSGVRGAEVLADSTGGAWFTVMGAPFLGHVSAKGAVERIPIGGSGTYLGLLETPDGAVWVADFGGDGVIRVAKDGSQTVWKAPADAKPQGLALGEAGAVWVTESGADRLARACGTALVQGQGTGQWPDHIAITADGWAWFSEYYQDRVGRVRLPGC